MMPSVAELKALMQTHSDDQSIQLLRNTYGGIEGLARQLNVPSLRQGLDGNTADLDERKALFGKNYIEPVPPKSFLALMWEALHDLILVVLIIAGIISLVLGVTVEEDKQTGWIEGASILVAVLIVTLVTAANDYQKERQFRKLNAVNDDVSIKVIRRGDFSHISIKDIVVGDIVQLEVGDILPADGIIFESNDLKIDESALTGESDLIKKSVEQRPFMLSGTKVMEGSGKMLVVAVGENSQAGIIMTLVSGGGPSAKPSSALPAAATRYGTMPAPTITVVGSDLGSGATAAQQGNPPGTSSPHNLSNSSSQESAGSPVAASPAVGTLGLPSPNRSESSASDRSSGSDSDSDTEAAGQGKHHKHGKHHSFFFGLSAEERKKRKEKKELEKKEKEQEQQDKSVLQGKLERLSVQIGKIGIATAVIVILVLVLRFSIETFAVDGQSWDSDYFSRYLSFFIIGVTILVVAIPEGLPLAVTLSLAFSVRKMLADNNLVRHLDACETMGSATTICSDKTGTLTTNRMTVMRCWTGEKEYSSPGEILESAAQSAMATNVFCAGVALNSTAEVRFVAPRARVESGSGQNMALTGGMTPASSDASLDNHHHHRRHHSDWYNRVFHRREYKAMKDEEARHAASESGAQHVAEQHTGNKTECALLSFAHKLGTNYPQMRESFKPVKIITFSSARKRMSVVVRGCPDKQMRRENEASSSGTGEASSSSSSSAPLYTLYSKGASEIILGLCDTVLDADGSESKPLTAEMKTAIMDGVINKYASEGLRTLTLAVRRFHEEKDWENVAPEELESHMTLVSIVGIEDPVREEVPAAIAKCQRAGIVVRMVTGDNITTARSIAKKCGILPPDSATGNAVADLEAYEQARQSAYSAKGENLPLFASHQDKHKRPSETATRMSPPPGEAPSPSHRGSDIGAPVVMEGPDFRKRVLDENGNIKQDVFDTIWPHLRVLARSSPQDKYTLVTGLINSKLNKNRQVVAVTGDGTNDSPALKKADVGFAMGICGTRIAKDASDIILMDDNFNSIVKAVVWGRNVYDSIAKFIQFQLTVNLVAITTAIVGAIAIEGSPLTAVQLLWVNLLMDSFASLALATEPPTEELLNRKPYGRNKALISRIMLRNILGHALFQLAIMFTLVFALDKILDIENGRDTIDKENASPTQHFTMVFNTFVLLQIVNQINARKIHSEHNVFRGIFNNWIFVVIMCGEIAVQVLIVNFGGRAFNCDRLEAYQWAICVVIALLEIPFGFLLSFVSINIIPRRLAIGKEPSKQVLSTANESAKTLWVRSIHRVQTQVQVVNAFRAAALHHYAHNPTVAASDV